MQLITAFDLATRNEAELRALFREVSRVFVRTDRDSPERRIALASLENIAAAIHSRTAFKGGVSALIEHLSLSVS